MCSWLGHFVPPYPRPHKLKKISLVSVPHISQYAQNKENLDVLIAALRVLLRGTRHVFLL